MLKSQIRPPTLINVEQVALFDSEGRRSGFYGNQRTDTGAVLGVTSDRYGIVQHGSLIEAAEEVSRTLASVSSSGTSSSLVTVRGCVLTTTSRIRPRPSPRGSQVGDEVGLRRTFRTRLTVAARVVRVARFGWFAPTVDHSRKRGEHDQEALGQRRDLIP